MKFRLLSAAVIALALVWGCGKDTDSFQSVGGLDQQRSDTGTTRTLEILAVQPHHSISDMDANYVTRWMENRTNVHVDWTVIPVKDANVIIEMQFAGNGPFSEAIFLGENSALTVERAYEYGLRGLIVPIQDYIDESAPRIRELFEKYPGSRDWVTLSDGNIYGFGDFGVCPHCEYAQKLWINRTWLDELDLEMPRTTGDFYEVMKAFRDNDPNGNGLNDEIPLTGGRSANDDVGSWHINIDGFLMNPFIYNDGLDRIVVENGTVLPAYTDPRWREGLRFLTKLFKEAIIDSDAFIQRSSRARSLVEQDVQRIGAAPGGTPAFFSRLSGEATKHYEVVPPLTGSDGVARTGYYPSAQIGIQPQFVITRDAKDPAVIIRWLDFGLTSEANFTRLRGEKDVDWRYARDGEIGIDGEPAVWKDKLGVDIESAQNKTWHGFPVAEWGIEQGLRLVADPDDPWEIEGRLYRSTQPYISHGPDKVASLLKISRTQVTEYERLRTLINAYVEDWIPRFVTGAADLETEWDRYLDGLKDLEIDQYMTIVADAVSAKYGESFQMSW